MLDEKEDNSVSVSSSGDGLEARMSRRAVKQLMQRVLPDAMSEEDKDERRCKTPSISHRDLGKAANTLAYVGSTGRVISHGREFLQCERYGAGDVVGCGVLLDANTFFFTLNGRLMGMLEARDVYDLDDFGEVTCDESGDAWESEKENGGENGEMNGGVGTSGNGVSIDLNDVDMEEVDGRLDEEKVLYPTVSLHGTGECVHTVFKPEEFQFDLLGFEQEIRKERQRALLEEREKRSADGPSSDIEVKESKDEAAMNELVQDFFLQYGYENAFKAFEAALGPSKCCLQASDAVGAENEAGGGSNGAGYVEYMEDEEKCEDTDSAKDGHLSLNSPKKQLTRRSLSLRHEVRDRIRCFQTADALDMLEKHTPVLVKNGTSNRLQQFRKLLLYCRILCVIDILTRETKVTASSPLTTNGASRSLKVSGPIEVQCNGWNPEPAIEYAQQAFGSFAEATNGKRKRQERNGTLSKKNDGVSDVELAMSLLLYDQRESVPSTSRAQKFLTQEFRESVADQLNSLLLMDDALGDSSSRVSSLETFIKDLGDLQKECLYNGCRVFPESVATASPVKCKTPQSRRRASLSSSSDDSSSSSQSEQDGRLDDDDDDEE